MKTFGGQNLADLSIMQVRAARGDWQAYTTGE